MEEMVRAPPLGPPVLRVREEMEEPRRRWARVEVEEAEAEGLSREKEERRKARAIASGEEVPKKPSALDRFKRSS